MKEKFCPVCGTSMKLIDVIENKTIYECKDRNCRQELIRLDDEDKIITTINRDSIEYRMDNIIFTKFSNRILLGDTSDHFMVSLSMRDFNTLVELINFVGGIK